VLLCWAGQRPPRLWLAAGTPLPLPGRMAQLAHGGSSIGGAVVAGSAQAYQVARSIADPRQVERALAQVAGALAIDGQA
jgi:hypothetical protein